MFRKKGKQAKAARYLVFPSYLHIKGLHVLECTCWAGKQSVSSGFSLKRLILVFDVIQFGVEIFVSIMPNLDCDVEQSNVWLWQTHRRF